MRILLPNGLEKRIAIEKKISLLWGAHETGKQFVTIQCESNQELAEWTFASFKSPMTVVPISSHLPAPAVRRIQEQLPMEKWISQANLKRSGSEVADFSKPLDQPWVVIFTSGSTGKPKGVALSGQQLKNSAEAHQQRFPQQPWLFSIPAFHIGGFSILSRSYFLDLPFAISTNKPQDWIPWFSDGRVSGISMVPTQLEKLLTITNSVGCIKTILVGGAAISPPLESRARDLPVYLTYGMTETASQIATSSSPWSPPIPMGNAEFAVSGDSELLIKSNTLALGYFEEGALKPLPLQDGFFPTGDIGKLENRSVSLLGRKLERIQSGGVKVFPLEIESQMRDFSAIDPSALAGEIFDYAVCGIPDSYWGEMIVFAYCGPENLVSEIREHLSSKLDQRLIPKHIVPVEKIPRTENGKILRKDLSLIVSDILCKKK